MFDWNLVVTGLVSGLAVWFIRRAIILGAKVTSDSIIVLTKDIETITTEVSEVEKNTNKIEVHLAMMNGRIGTVESNMESHKELDEKLREGTHGRIKQIEESIKTLRQQA